MFVVDLNDVVESLLTNHGIGPTQKVALKQVRPDAPGVDIEWSHQPFVRAWLLPPER